MTDENATIRTFTNQPAAELAQSILQANGIRTMVLRDDAGGMLPSMSFGSEIRLVVAAADAEAAIEILDAGDG